MGREGQNLYLCLTQMLRKERFALWLAAFLAQTSGFNFNVSEIYNVKMSTSFVKGNPLSVVLVKFSFQNISYA